MSAREWSLADMVADEIEDYSTQDWIRIFKSCLTPLPTRKTAAQSQTMQIAAKIVIQLCQNESVLMSSVTCEELTAVSIGGPGVT